MPGFESAHRPLLLAFEPARNKFEACGMGALGCWSGLWAGVMSPAPLAGGYDAGIRLGATGSHRQYHLECYNSKIH